MRGLPGGCVYARLLQIDGHPYWLPAQSVAVETRWHPEPGTGSVPATQLITLRVTGLADVQLPHIAAPIVLA